MMSLSGSPEYSRLLGQRPISPLKELLKFPLGRSSHSLPALLVALAEGFSELAHHRLEEFKIKGEKLKSTLDHLLADDAILLHPPYSRPAPLRHSPWLTPFHFGFTAIFNVTEHPVGAKSRSGYREVYRSAFRSLHHMDATTLLYGLHQPRSRNRWMATATACRSCLTRPPICTHWMCTATRIRKVEMIERANLSAVDLENLRRLLRFLTNGSNWPKSMNPMTQTRWRSHRSTPDGSPALRMVLLKQHNADGFVFYTNYESRKGKALVESPKIAALFHWKCMLRQIRIEGTVEPVEDATADDYYHSRSRESQIGAWASKQSRP